MFRREERKKKEEKRIGQTKLKNLISKVFKKKWKKKLRNKVHSTARNWIASYPKREERWMTSEDDRAAPRFVREETLSRGKKLGWHQMAQPNGPTANSFLTCASCKCTTCNYSHASARAALKRNVRGERGKREHAIAGCAYPFLRLMSTFAFEKKRGEREREREGAKKCTTGSMTPVNLTGKA